MRVADRPEFTEIPAEVKARLEKQVRMRAFEVLHAEAVRRGDLGAPPATYFDGLAGRILGLLFAVAFGVLLGSLSVILVLYMGRLLAPVL